jgi:phospholipid-binding lipoprotein MlaA
MMRKSILMTALWAALVLGGQSASAQDPTSASPPTPQVTAPPPVTTEPTSLDRFNAVMHDFNLWSFAAFDAAGEWIGVLQPPAAVSSALSNMLANFINEPTAAISWAVAGDYDNSRTALWRFWTNTTRGWLGIEDVARSEGIVTPPIDIGLALCTRGVSEGAYVVLPFIGPRTVRDGLSDFFLINVITYLTLSPIIGFPPSLQTIATLEVVEEFGKVAAIRQIDHGDDRNPSANAVKDQYLTARRERCEQLTRLLKTTQTSGE